MNKQEKIICFVLGIALMWCFFSGRSSKPAETAEAASSAAVTNEVTQAVVAPAPAEPKAAVVEAPSVPDSIVVNTPAPSYYMTAGMLHSEFNRLVRNNWKKKKK